MVDTTLKENINNLPFRLMFQDEAGFGRMSQPKSCWAPYPARPMVAVALVREFRYICATVSPWDGRLSYSITEKMNTENMNIHLSQVSKRFKYSFNVIIVDGASSHRSKDLIIPKNIGLIQLPPYSPELNPAEQIWRLLRGQYFANKIFNSLDDAIVQVKKGLLPRRIIMIIYFFIDFTL
ncbi:MAG: IS630 family transposase [Deltaproteobacteria bacterium]|nr:IS630 family transposase [Deltaproteobacteria bacterium]